MQTPPALTGKQNRHLRSLAHSLDPVVHIGKHGWTEGLRDELDRALDDHELIKVKLGRESPLEPQELVHTLADELSAHVAQSIGAILVVYRRHPKKPKIRLPAPAGSLG